MDNISNIKFTIVTPSYNQGAYLEKTILSVIEQGYPNLEYIIIDGGSTDESIEIIKKYENHLSYWESETDRGQSHAINKGFKHASGDLYGWLNSDDYYTPNALKTVAGIYQNNPEVGAIVGAGDLVDERGNVLRHDLPFEITPESLYHWIERHFWQPSCFFTSEAWTSCGPLSEKLTYAMDFDLWLNIAKKFQFATTDVLLSNNLKHENAKTTAYASHSTVDTAFVIQAHGGEEKAKKALKKYLADVQDRIGELEDQLKRVEKQLKINQEQHKKDIEAIQNSLSWKITAPLRKIAEILGPK